MVAEAWDQVVVAVVVAVVAAVVVAAVAEMVGMGCPRASTIAWPRHSLCFQSKPSAPCVPRPLDACWCK